MNPSGISSFEGLQLSFFRFFVPSTLDDMLTVNDGNIFGITINAAVVRSDMYIQNKNNNTIQINKHLNTINYFIAW